MKKLLLSAVLATLAFAQIEVDATYSTLGAVAKKIGGELVHVTVLGSPKFDPHFIVPKPSLLSKLRRADLLIINGGGLEIGFLPPLITNANNANIQPGAKGFLDVSNYIDMINKPVSVSRGFGDIHAMGNPHYVMDPHNIPIIAKVITNKLSLLDSQNTKVYETNLANFLKIWDKYLVQLDAKMATCKDKKLVQYHILFNYFLERYDFVSFGNIEPLPGIAPSSKHTIELINTMKENGIKTILQDVYHEKKTAEFIASKTDAKVLTLPHDVDAVKSADTLENFYNTISDQLCR